MKFSFLISCYDNDCPVAFKESLSSISDQSFIDFEVVIICDGKINACLIEIITNFIKSVSFPVYLIKLPINIGLGPALSFGVSKCSGQYIVRQDSDDISYRNRLETLNDITNCYDNIDVIGTFIDEFSISSDQVHSVRKVPLLHKNIVKFSKFRNPMNHVSVCFKKEVFQNNNYSNVPLHEDYFFWLCLIKDNYKFQNFPISTVYVRTSNNSFFRTGFRYFLYEILFLNLCFKNRHFTFFDCVRYIIPRLPCRFMPDFMLRYIYKKYLRN